MSWRTVVVTKPSKLDYTMGYMTVRDVDNTVKIHLSEISILIVENTACSITCALLSELTLKKIKVIFCDAKRNPQSELVSYYGSHDCSQKLKNQIAWSEISKQQVWTVIVAQKIKNQASLLEFYGLEEALLLDSFQTISVHLVGNLIDIIGDTGKVTNSRYHFRTDALTDLTIHCSLMAKFIDRQSSLLRFGLDINVVVLGKHYPKTFRAFLITRQLRATTKFLILHTYLNFYVHKLIF